MFYSSRYGKIESKNNQTLETWEYPIIHTKRMLQAVEGMPDTNVRTTCIRARPKKTPLIIVVISINRIIHGIEQLDADPAEFTMWTQRHSYSKRNTGKTGPPEDSQFQRDRARIIHSSSFRSLQSKTQVLGLGESDFYRTRLTHSLEVAQIGSGICERLRNSPAVADEHKQWIPSFSLIEAICLAHDIGHPPFGHGGEIATNYMMRNHGGFEANGQTFRIQTKLGEYSEEDGLDLTRRTLLGTIKYPAFYDELINSDLTYPGLKENNSNIEHWTPPKCIFREEEPVFQWILSVFETPDRLKFREIEAVDGRHSKTKYKAFDSTIMEMADDIAYGVHDLEDAIALNLLDRHDWNQYTHEFLQGRGRIPFAESLDFYTDRLFSNTNKGRKHAISKLVSYFLSNIHIAENGAFSHPLMKLQAEMEPNACQTLCFLKDLIMQHVILKPELQSLQFKGQQVIIKLFDVLADNPKQLLPQSVYEQYKINSESLRIICDYVAGMTDISASRYYHKLFSPRTGSMFDRI